MNGSSPAAAPDPNTPLGAAMLGGNRAAFLVWAPLAKTVDVHVCGPGNASCA